MTTQIPGRDPLARADHIGRVAVALLRGARLSSPNGYTVVDAVGGGRFACLDRYNTVVPVREEWDETPPRGAWTSRITCSRHDWTAFGAARAFVAILRWGDVEDALRRVRG